MTRRELSAMRTAVLAAMRRKGWSAYRLGKEAGIDPSHVARWLDASRADHQPHITTKRLEPILAALGLSILHPHATEQDAQHQDQEGKDSDGLPPEHDDQSGDGGAP